MSRTHAPGLAVLALALLPSAAAGNASPKTGPARVALEFQRRASARSCPSERELRAAVSEILGYQPFDRRAQRALGCVLWQDGDIFHAQLRLRDARTRRSLGVRALTSQGPSCQELGSAVALAIALAIDPLARPSPTRPLEAPPVAAPPVVSTGVGSAGAAGASASSAPPSARVMQPPSRPTPPVAGAQPVPPPLAVAAASVGPDAGFQAEPPAPGADAGTAAPALAVADAGSPAVAAAAAPVAAAPAPQPTPPPPSAPTEAESGAARSAEATASGTPGDATPSAVASRAEPAPWQILAGLGVDWTLGLVPSSSGAFGPVAHAGVAWSFASVELEARWLPPTSSGFNGGTVSSTLWSGALVGCARFGQWGACGLVQVGAQTSTGEALPQAQTTTTVVVALGVRGQWDWVFARPVGLRLNVDGMVNAVRPRLVLNDAGGTAVGSTSTASLFSLAVGAGLFVVF